MVGGGIENCGGTLRTEKKSLSCIRRSNTLQLFFSHDRNLRQSKKKAPLNRQFYFSVVVKKNKDKKKRKIIIHATVTDILIV